MTTLLNDRFPYVRVGDGKPPVVILPGLSVRNAPVGAVTAKGYAVSFKTLAADHTLHFVGRPRGLRAGMSTRDIAAECAALIAAEIGPADVIGMSTGGLIATHVAADRPDLATSLTLVVSGPRLSPSGLEIGRRWQDLAAAGRWSRLNGEVMAVALDGRAAKWMSRMVMTAFGSRPDAREAADFAVTIGAVLAHDGTAALAGLSRPALIIQGEHDPFFRAEPDALVYPGAGHGLAKRQGGRLQRDIAAFLARRITA